MAPARSRSGLTNAKHLLVRVYISLWTPVTCYACPQRGMSQVSDSPDTAGKLEERRKLIALVHMDMVAFSKLMGLDDVGTLGRLRALRCGPAQSRHAGSMSAGWLSKACGASPSQPSNNSER